MGFANSEWGNTLLVPALWSGRVPIMINEAPALMFPADTQTAPGHVSLSEHNLGQGAVLWPNLMDGVDVCSSLLHAVKCTAIQMMQMKTFRQKHRPWLILFPFQRQVKVRFEFLRMRKECYDDVTGSVNVNLKLFYIASDKSYRNGKLLPTLGMYLPSSSDQNKVHYCLAWMPASRSASGNCSFCSSQCFSKHKHNNLLKGDLRKTSTRLVSFF